MRRFAFVPFVLLALTGAAAAQLAPQAEDFLRGIGIDPDSPAVTVLRHDKVNGVGLNSLAAAGDERGVRTFIATRKFLYDLKANPPGPHTAPDESVFDPHTYMTEAERAYALKVFFGTR